MKSNLQNLTIKYKHRLESLEKILTKLELLECPSPTDIEDKKILKVVTLLWKTVVKDLNELTDKS